jgi:hypothetical protein
MQKVFCLICIMVVFFGGGACAEGIDMMVFGGYSMYDDAFNIYWDPSYTVGLKAFYHVSRYIHLGGCISYGILSPRDGNDIFGVGCDWTDSGDGALFEIVPSVRLSYPVITDNTYVYSQFGVGYYIVDFDATYSGTVISPDPGDPIVKEIDFKTGDVGFNAGVGIRTNIRGRLYLEIYPNYTIISTEGESIDYMNISCGINFAL